MEDTSGKIIKGCGIGCAVIFGLIILILAIGYFKVKDKLNEFKEFEELGTIIETKFGILEDFTPSANSAEFNERIKRFVLIRNELFPLGKNLEEEILTFESSIKNQDESFWDAFDIMSSGLGLIPELLKYYKSRNDILIKYEMGLGEYYYNYIIVYYCLLNKSPGDGPAFNISNHISVELKEEQNESGWRSIEEERDEEIRKQANRYFIFFYSNLINNPEHKLADDFLGVLQNELDKLKENKLRLPWSEGLPPFYTDVLEKQQTTLDSLYIKMLNPVEMNEMPE